MKLAWKALGVLFGVVLCCTLVLSDVNAQQPLTLRVSVVSPVGGTEYRAVEVFASDLKKRVGEDRVKITLYATGQLGTYNEILTQIQSGANLVEALFDSLGDIGPWNKLAGLETVPYMYRDSAHFVRVWSGPIGEEIANTVAGQSGFRLVGPGFRGFREMSVNKPVRKAEDLAGLKLRVPAIPAYIDAWKALGANPTPIPFEETFTAIQQKIVDGQENPLNVIVDSSFYTICKYLIMTNHMAETMGFLFNDKWYQALDPAMRNAIKAAAATSADWLRAESAKNADGQIQKVKAAGMEVINPDLSGFLERAKAAKLDPALEPWAVKIRQVQ